MKVSKRQVAKLHNEAARHFNQKDKLSRLLEEAKSDYFKYRAIEQLTSGPIGTVTLALIARSRGSTIKGRREFFAVVKGQIEGLGDQYDTFPADFFKERAVECLWSNSMTLAAAFLTIYLVRRAS